MGGARRWRGILAVWLGLVAAISSSTAQAAERKHPEPVSPYAVEEPIATDRPVDRGVVRREPISAAATSPFRTYYDQHGHSIRIAFWDAYYPDASVAQSYADFLGSLLHGGEMNRLSVVILTEQELAGTCGSNAAACYVGASQRMYVSGDGPIAGIPTEYSIAHEYGHHASNNRSNAPWPAFDWGPKYWASHEFVCSGVQAGELTPDGSRGWRYRRDPSEAFAETNAIYNWGPETRWQYHPALKPNSASFTALRRDIVSPWSRRTVAHFDGTLTGRERFERQYVSTPLDGTLSVALLSPKGADFISTSLAVEGTAGSDDP